MKKIIALIFILIPFATSAQQSRKEYLQVSRDAFVNGDFEKALEMLRQAEKLSVNAQEKAVAENAIGWVQHSLGSSEEAKKSLAEALGKAVKAGDAELAQKSSNNLGVIYFSQGDIEKAYEQFTSKWSQGSTSAEMYLSMIQEQKKQQQVNSFIAQGILHRMNGEFEKAVAEYDKALQISPEDSKALEYKGYALYRMENYSDATELLEKAHGLAKERISIIINLMKVYCVSGKYDAMKKIMKDNASIIEENKDYMQEDGELSRNCDDFMKTETSK